MCQMTLLTLPSFYRGRVLALPTMIVRISVPGHATTQSDVERARAHSRDLSYARLRSRSTLERKLGRTPDRKSSVDVPRIDARDHLAVRAASSEPKRA